MFAAESDRPVITGRRALYGLAAVASLLFLATVVFGADEFTGLSGRPTIQRATTW